MFWLSAVSALLIVFDHALRPRLADPLARVEFDSLYN